MSFVSFSFILFIACTALLYFIVPKKWRWGVLLAASYVFYYLSSKWLLLVHLGTVLITYGAGMLMDRISSEGSRLLKEKGDSLSKEEKKELRAKTKGKVKLVLRIAILIDLCTLLFLKYWNFFIGSVNPLLSKIGFRAPELNLLLPIGISFYTLQAIAYLVDISRGKITPDKNPLKFMLFMSYFPQIVQGPIARHSQLAAQLYEGHSFDLMRLWQGFQLMLWGWFKKMVIADRISIAIDTVIDSAPGTYHGLIIFFSFALYGIQIYADFSGGMDIARGFSQIVGLNLELNFNQPYFSRSVEDFWRRWHITLGSWMRDYVFYPLSLSKAFAQLGKKARGIFGSSFGKKLPAILSMFIVYFLVGIWHGSSYKYVAYGIWNGLFISGGILLEEVYAKGRGLLGVIEDSSVHHIVEIVRTFIVVSFGRYFPRAYSLKYAIYFMRDTFVSWNDLSFLIDGSLKRMGLNTANWFLLLAALLVLLAVDLMHERGIHIREELAKQHPLIQWAVLMAAILSILIFGIYGPEYDAASFIYEQF